MPLLDHFHPPLSRQRHWDSFHGAWAEAVAKHFNEDLLPEHFFAEARINIGGRIEIDVATLTENSSPRQSSEESGGVALWAPAKPLVAVPLDFATLDLIEVLVINDEEGPRVVAAIEFVSPANKDRPGNRKMFAVKCASYLQEGIGLAVVDVVTERRGNLHAGLLELLNLQVETPAQGPADLYAAAYRTTGNHEGLRLEIWAELLALGSPLPTLPLWIGPDLSIPLDLESTYLAACQARRIQFNGN